MSELRSPLAPAIDDLWEHRAELSPAGRISIGRRVALAPEGRRRRGCRGRLRGLLVQTQGIGKVSQRDRSAIVLNSRLPFLFGHLAQRPQCLLMLPGEELGQSQSAAQAASLAG